MPTILKRPAKRTVVAKQLLEKHKSEVDNYFNFIVRSELDKYIKVGKLSKLKASEEKLIKMGLLTKGRTYRDKLIEKKKKQIIRLGAYLKEKYEK
ncbi:MAG: hypothetical protein WCX82_04230 [archaeon]|jgi:hypothetical protein